MNWYEKPNLVHGCGIGVVLMLAAATWLLAVEPSLSSRSAYYALASERRGLQDQLRSAQAAEENAANQLTSLQTLLRTHPLILRSQVELSRKLEEISQLTTRTGVQLESLEAGKPESYARHGTVEIQLSARCSALALWKMLSEFRTQMPDVTVRSVDFTGRYTNQDSVPALTMSLVWHTAPESVASMRQGAGSW